ncbi:MerR family transcriptional regulator [Cellulomonas sp. NPDC055163]
MSSALVPPRQVTIGDAAAFAGTTPRAIRHYHAIGVLPEPERGSDGRRRYGYEQMIRLLWVRRMAEAGIALDDIRDAFADAPGPGPVTGPGAGTGPGPDAASDHEVAGILERLERTLAAREAELQRQRAAVQRMRTRGSRLGLLSDVVAGRFDDLPEGSVRQADLDSLLVVERIFGPLGAAVHASRYVAVATHPGLQEESDRVDAAEEALDDTIAVDDPRVARVAAERHAFELALHAVIEDSGLAQDDDALLDAWDELNPPGDVAGGSSGTGHESMSALTAVGKMPYDFSPARLRCMELADELAAHGSLDAERAGRPDAPVDSGVARPSE